jgi:alpha-soluble NSF attachment protein
MLTFDAVNSAGKAFEKAAQMQLKSEAKDEAANTYIEAYKSYRKNDPEGMLHERHL